MNEGRSGQVNDISDHKLDRPITSQEELDQEELEQYMEVDDAPVASRTRANKRKGCLPSPVEAKRMREEAIGLAAYFYSLH